VRSWLVTEGKSRSLGTFRPDTSSTRVKKEKQLEVASVRRSFFQATPAPPAGPWWRAPSPSRPLGLTSGRRPVVGEDKTEAPLKPEAARKPFAGDEKFSVRTREKKTAPGTGRDSVCFIGPPRVWNANVTGAKVGPPGLVPAAARLGEIHVITPESTRKIPKGFPVADSQPTSYAFVKFPNRARTRSHAPIRQTYIPLEGSPPGPPRVPRILTSSADDRACSTEIHIGQTGGGPAEADVPNLFSFSPFPQFGRRTEFPRTFPLQRWDRIEDRSESTSWNPAVSFLLGDARRARQKPAWYWRRTSPVRRATIGPALDRRTTRRLAKAAVHKVKGGAAWSSPVSGAEAFLRRPRVRSLTWETCDRSPNLHATFGLPALKAEKGRQLKRRASNVHSICPASAITDLASGWRQGRPVPPQAAFERRHLDHGQSPQARVLNSDGARALRPGPYVQVSRLAIPSSTRCWCRWRKRDKWNAQSPSW